MGGFTCFNTRPMAQNPSISELVAALDGEEKIKILRGFTVLGRKAYGVVASRLMLNEKVVDRLFGKIDDMQKLSASLMRGEIVITPAEVDQQTGEEITPAVYNTPPANAGALLAAVQDEFSDDFNPVQVTAILTKMVEYSKWNGSGDWVFYSNEIIK
jgi:hypothetical protein